MYYSIIGLICITIIGFIAHRAGLCLVRGVKLALDRQPSLLLAMLLSGLWVGGYGLLANLNGWPQPLNRFAFHPLFALGGFVFGLGASINQGCSVSTMHQFARGNLSMMFTMLGWLGGWLIWQSFSHANLIDISYQQLPPLDHTVGVTLFALAVGFTVVMVWFFPRERWRWIGISIIGLLVSVMFYVEPVWAPSRLIQDTGAALLEGKPTPSGYRNALLMMLLLGMWLSVFLLRDIKLRWPTLHKVVRHSVAGLMMGLGGAMALGGNDVQILMGLPALSIGAVTGLIFMLLGITVEQLLYHRGKLFYQKL